MRRGDGGVDKCGGNLEQNKIVVFLFFVFNFK